MSSPPKDSVYTLVAILKNLERSLSKSANAALHFSRKSLFRGLRIQEVTN